MSQRPVQSWEFKINDTVRVRGCAVPDGSIEFKIARFEEGNGTFTQLGKVYAAGPSLHSTAQIVWPIEELVLINEATRG